VLLTIVLKNYGGRSVDVMKKGIHPTYHKTKVTCTTCGAVFETGSILSEIKVDTCANCHPFYTGKQTFVQADGRVEKFNKRYGLNKNN
jgi:large subunit ribosomal protein L31